MGFVHLHCHTDYSLGDSTARIDQYIEAAHEVGMKALAISDTNSIAGAIVFSEACRQAGIKPMIASELSFKDGGIVCIAMDEEGMNNLAVLVTLSRKGLCLDDVADHHEGLICLSGGSDGGLAKRLASGKGEEARNLALMFRNVFRDRFYIELQDHGKAEEKAVLPLLKGLADELGIECVCTNDVHYMCRDDADAYDTLCCIRDGKQKNTPVPEGEYYFKTEAEMSALFSWCPGALENTSRIADRCSLDFIGYSHDLLRFPCPEIHQNPDEHLAALANEGLAKRYVIADEKIQARLREELRAIRKTGCAGLFLVVHDIVSWARHEGIAMSAGRWPYVGFLVCYLLEITDVDPLVHGLISEGFINIEYPAEAIYMPLLTSPDGRSRIIGHITAEFEDHCLAYAGCRYTEFDSWETVSSVASVYGCPEFPFPAYHRRHLTLEELGTFLKVWNAFSLRPVEYAGSFIESVRAISDLKHGYSVDENRKYASSPMYGKTLIWSSRKNRLPLVTNPDHDLPVADYDRLSPAQDFQIITADHLQYIEKAEKMIRKEYAPGFDIRKIDLTDEKVFESMIPRSPYEESYEFLSPVEEISGDTVRCMSPWDDEEPRFWKLLELIRPRNISGFAASIAFVPLIKELNIDEFIAEVNDVYGSTSAAVLEQCILYEEDFILELSALGSCTIAEVENALRLIRKKDKSGINGLKEKYLWKEMGNGVAWKEALERLYTLEGNYRQFNDGHLPSKAQCISCAIDSYRLAYIATYHPDVASKVFRSGQTTRLKLLNIGVDS